MREIQVSNFNNQYIFVMALYGSNQKLWENAISKVVDVFKIPSLYKEQKEALIQFFSKRDVFVNLPTSLFFNPYQSCRIFSFEDVRAQAL